MLAMWYVEERNGQIKVSEAIASCLCTDIDRLFKVSDGYRMYTNVKTEEQAVDLFKKLKTADPMKPCWKCDRRVDAMCRGWRSRCKCKPYKSWRKLALGEEV